MLHDNLEIERWRDDPRMDGPRLQQARRAYARPGRHADGGTRASYAPSVEVSLEHDKADATVRSRSSPAHGVRVGKVTLEFRGTMRRPSRGRETVAAGFAPSAAAAQVRRHLPPGRLGRRRAPRRCARCWSNTPQRRASSPAAPASIHRRCTPISGLICSTADRRCRLGTTEMPRPEALMQRAFVQQPLEPDRLRRHDYRLCGTAQAPDAGCRNSNGFDRVSVEAATADAPTGAVAGRWFTLVEAERKRINLGAELRAADTGSSPARSSTRTTTSPGAGCGCHRAQLDKTAQSASVTLSPPVRPDGARDSIGASLTKSDLQGENMSTFALDGKRTRTVSASRQRRAAVPGGDAPGRRRADRRRPGAGAVLRLDPQKSTRFWRRSGRTCWTCSSAPRRSTCFPTAASRAPTPTGPALPDRDARDAHPARRGRRGAAGGRDGIPSSYLFRTGGDQSVRGYAYQSLGVAEGSAWSAAGCSVSPAPSWCAG